MARGARERAPAAALTVAAAVTAAGCVPWLERPFDGLRDAPASVPAPLDTSAEPPVPCVGGPHSSGWPKSPGTVAIGPLSFRGLALRRAPLRFKPGSPPLTLPVFLPPGTQATISVPAGFREVAGLDSASVPATTPTDAHRALICSTGSLGGVFTVSFVVVGSRCVPISVDSRGRRWTRTVHFGRACTPSP